MEEKIAIKKEKKIDSTLSELFIGIILWGVLCQISGVWFVKDKVGYSLGLWIGIFLALAAGFHMWWALDKALDFTQDAAVKIMVKYNIIRYLIIVLVLAVVMITDVANPLTAFLGLIGLKVAAYIQPFTNKISSKILRR